MSDLTSLCDNPELAGYIADFALCIGRYARLGLIRPERQVQSLADWKSLLRAIGEGNPEEAERLHRHLSAQNLAAAVAELESRERRAQSSLPAPRRRRTSREAA